VNLPDRLAAERERRRRGRHSLLRVAGVLGDVPLHERQRLVDLLRLHEHQVTRIERAERHLARAELAAHQFGVRDAAPAGRAVVEESQALPLGAAGCCGSREKKMTLSGQ
jgi:hypothetical protein